MERARRDHKSDDKPDRHFEAKLHRDGALVGRRIRGHVRQRRGDGCGEVERKENREVVPGEAGEFSALSHVADERQYEPNTKGL